MKPKKLEQILATFDPRFNTILQSSGQEIIVSKIEGSYNEVFDPAFLMTGARDTLDNNPQFNHIRQLIPYTIVTCNGMVAVYSRTSKSEESRLHDKLSIGFGGHIDSTDILYWQNEVNCPTCPNGTIDLHVTLEVGVTRELEEEFGLDELNMVGADYTPTDPNNVNSVVRTHALIISTQSEVDRVHLGLATRVEVKDISTLSIEDELNFVGWFSEQELRDGNSIDGSVSFANLESWSKALIAEGISNIPTLFNN